MNIMVNQPDKNPVNALKELIDNRDRDFYGNLGNMVLMFHGAQHAYKEMKEFAAEIIRTPLSMKKVIDAVANRYYNNYKQTYSKNVNKNNN